MGWNGMARPSTGYIAYKWMQAFSFQENSTFNRFKHHCILNTHTLCLMILISETDLQYHFDEFSYKIQFFIASVTFNRFHFPFLLHVPILWYMMHFNSLYSYRDLYSRRWTVSVLLLCSYIYIIPIRITGYILFLFQVITLTVQLSFHHFLIFHSEQIYVI